MEKEINIDDGLMRFRMGELLIELDPIDTIVECGLIADRTKAMSNFEYLDQFAEWVKGRCDVELTRGQTFSLWRAVHFEHAQAGKSFTDALKSLTSTGSTPEA